MKRTMVLPFACFGRSLPVTKEMLPRGRRWAPRDAVSCLLKNHPPCGPDLKPLVISARHTGFRSSELFSIAWKDIAFRNRLIAVEDAYTKNGGSRRVPMNEMLTEALRTTKIEELAILDFRSWPKVTAIFLRPRDSNCCMPCEFLR
jgi:integrase